MVPGLAGIGHRGAHRCNDAVALMTPRPHPTTLDNIAYPLTLILSVPF